MIRLAATTASLLCLSFFAPSVSQPTPPQLPVEPVEVKAEETAESMTVSQVVEPLTELVGMAEADPVGGWNAANNGYPLDLGKDGFIKVFGRPTSEVTVGEILLAQAQRRIHAVGRYQIIGITLKGLVAARCISGSQLFTEKVQNDAFICLIKKNRPAVWRYISTGQGIVPAANAMSREWASMPYSHGRSYYGGADKAHATRAELFDALEAVRANYLGTLTQSEVEA